MQNIVIFGASGTIGNALVQKFAESFSGAYIHAVTRAENNAPYTNNVHSHVLDFLDEKALKQLAKKIAEQGSITHVIVATGLLHNQRLRPEKALSQVKADNLQELFLVNATMPMLVAKHFVPKLSAEQKSVFACLSARVGSISDNKLGGWYGYRASKSALNMLIKTTAIETARKNKHAVIVGLHPGTVASDLSAPFSKNVPEGKLFAPEYSAQCLADVVDKLTAKDTGKCFAWDGSEIFG